MRIHPKLTGFSKAKYLKLFSEYLKNIEKDLTKLHCSNFKAEIVSFDPPRLTLMKRLFGSPDYNSPAEILNISTTLYDCPVEIDLFMSYQGIPMPYTIRVILPVPMKGRAEYRIGGGMFPRHSWCCEPPDKGRVKDLERSMPSIGITHGMGSIRYSVQVGYILEAISSHKTEWIIHSAYEGTLFSSSLPRVHKYLATIPIVESMLRKWKN